jgi:hypothetical protein
VRAEKIEALTVALRFNLLRPGTAWIIAGAGFAEYYTQALAFWIDLIP